VTNESNALAINFLKARESRESGLGVGENLTHKGVTLDQAIAHFIEVVERVIWMWFRASRSDAAILKAYRVWCENNQASRGQKWPKCLMRVANKAADFALSEVTFAVVLVMDDDRGRWGAETVWDQEVGRNPIAVGA
jgi:hypothetical protein